MNSSIYGSGMTKTADIGGARFGVWSNKAFNPTSFVATTVNAPIAQLSAPPTYSAMGNGGQPSPNQVKAAVGNPFSPKSVSFWVLLAIVVIIVMFILKRTRKVR